MATGYTFVRTPDPIYVDTEEQAERWVERYWDCDAIAFDTETTGLRKFDDRIKFFSFSDGATRICAPVRLLDVFEPLLVKEDSEKRFANAKFDAHMAANHGIAIQGRWVDTVQMDWHFDENRTHHGLKETSRDHLGLRMAPFNEVFGKIGHKKTEVEAVCWFHDIIERHDHEAAADALVSIKKIDGDEKVLASLQKLSLSRRGGYTLDVRKLCAIARIHGIVQKHTGTRSYVSEFFEMLGGDVGVKERLDAEVALLSGPELVVEAHDIIFKALLSRVKIDMEPLEMLRLLVADYASLDAWATYRLTDVLREQLAVQDEGEGYTVLQRYEELSVPYTRVLWCMERRGLKADAESLANLSKRLHTKINKIERGVVKLAGADVNLNSVPQMQKLFYAQQPDGTWVDSLGNTPTLWTKGGESGVKLPSTKEEALTIMAERGDDLAKLVLEHREFEKLRGTYVDSLPNHLDPRGRIHCDIKQAGARTGRISAADPNLTNQPKKGDWGHLIRGSFIGGFWGDCDPMWCLPELRHVPVPNLPPDTPMDLIVADYAQLEVKVAAHESEDPTMVETLCAGKDIHSMTSAKLTGTPYEEFIAAKKAKEPTAEQKELLDIRDGNKSALFGIFFGIGSVKLGGQLGLPIIRKVDKHGRMREYCPEAQAIIDGVFKTYPRLKERILAAHATTHRDLFIQTFTGRYRRLPDIASNMRGIEAQAERQAFNVLTQGGGADIVQAAMLKCEHDPELRMLGVRMLLQVHDELIFEVPAYDEFRIPALARIKENMEHPMSQDLIVPTDISIRSGKSWDEAKG